MTDLLLNVFCFVCGSVIVYRCGEHIEMMRWTSNHLLRVAYWMLSVGGASLVFSAVDGERWLRTFGWVSVIGGMTLLLLFDRRSAAEPDGGRRRNRSAA